MNPAARETGRVRSAAGCAQPIRRGIRCAGAAAYPLFALALLALPAAAQTGAGPATERSVRALADRIEGLERRLGTSALIDLMTRIDRLVQETQQLRDRIEVQGHLLDDLRDRQQDLYAELDRLSRRAAVPASAPADVAERAPAAASGPRAGTGSTAAPSSPRDEVSSEDSTGSGRGEAGSGAPRYDPVEETSRYQLAFDLLSEGHFEQAAAAFADFRADFPDSRYRDDAWFWEGECLYALRRFGPALEEFQALVEHYPDSSRVPGAQLKIGFILHELGRSEEAAAVLEALVEAVPGSSEAKLARGRLERLQ